MKKIKFNDIKVGDYIKAVLSDEKYKEKEKDGFKETYFKVERKVFNTYIYAIKWVDFDYNNKFLRVLKEMSSLSDCDCEFYKLTEKEYRKLNKYLIVGELE